MIIIDSYDVSEREFHDKMMSFTGSAFSVEGLKILYAYLLDCETKNEEVLSFNVAEVDLQYTEDNFDWFFANWNIQIDANTETETETKEAIQEYLGSDFIGFTEDTVVYRDRDYNVM